MKLVLDDGKILSGQSFGAPVEVTGEVVFNTGMTGYVETLTDPSYRGQILVLTYPLVGNYGVPTGPFEAPEIQVQGLIVSHYSPNGPHYTLDQSLGSWLKKAGVPAISGIDTRSLTRYLREHGAIPGSLLLEEKEKLEAGQWNGHRVENFEMRKVLDLVAPQKIVRYPGGDLKVLVIDTGAKENIIRSLVQRGTSVIRAPWNQDWEKYVPEVDGIFLTNGPGDPMDANSLIERVRKLIDLDIPLFGICFGHQMLGLAAGAKTQKMKYGHRGVNQPVKDLTTGRCYITSQNHGYVVQTESLPKSFKPWFVNLNDGSNEGIRHVSKPICSVQFHPEASPGPNDTAFLFDEFLRTVRAHKKPVLKTQNFMNLPEVHLQ